MDYDFVTREPGLMIQRFKMATCTRSSLCLGGLMHEVNAALAAREQQTLGESLLQSGAHLWV